jgi:hypothetical protein
MKIDRKQKYETCKLFLSQKKLISCKYTIFIAIDPIEVKPFKIKVLAYLLIPGDLPCTIGPIGPKLKLPLKS